MADTTTAPANKAVRFQGEPHAEDARVTRPRAKAINKKAAKRAMKRGMISEKAAKRHLGGV